MPKLALSLGTPRRLLRFIKSEVFTTAFRLLAPNCGHSPARPEWHNEQRMGPMKRTRLDALALIAVTSGCVERKPPFSSEQFLAAKAQCGAVDAYVIDAAPNTIGFSGTSNDHMRQAKCLKAKLEGFDVKTVVLGSQLHERS